MKLFHVALVSAGSMILGAAAWGAAAPAVQKTWPMSLEATHAAPRNHKVLYEDDHVRLLEVTVRVGETENPHWHPYPSVFAFDAEQPAMSDHRIENDEHVSMPRRLTKDSDFPSCSTMGPQPPHQVTINDTFPQHFYRLEFKKMDKTDIADMHYGEGS